jgi:hypothetical protein
MSLVHASGVGRHCVVITDSHSKVRGAPRSVSCGASVGGAGPESIVLWQLIGIGLSTIVAPACLSLKVGRASPNSTVEFAA